MGWDYYVGLISLYLIYRDQNSSISNNDFFSLPSLIYRISELIQNEVTLYIGIQ